MRRDYTHSEPPTRTCHCVGGSPATAGAIVCVPHWWDDLRELAGLPAVRPSERTTGAGDLQAQRNRGAHDSNR